MNVGKIFESEIRRFLENKYVLLVRQYDTLGSRFSIEKVCDFIVMDEQGFFIAVECKSTRSDSFAFSRIKPHQAEALSRVAGTEYGKAFLALNFRDARGPGIAFLIPWHWWLNLERTWHKKSIQKREAITQFHEFRLARITGGWVKQGPRLI